MATQTQLDILRKQLSEEDYQAVIDQATMGDPDWVLDMIEEVKEGISPESDNYTLGFHDKLKPEEFDWELLWKELYALDRGEELNAEEEE
jgi:hypothetical protein